MEVFEAYYLEGHPLWPPNIPVKFCFSEEELSILELESDHLLITITEKNYLHSSCGNKFGPSTIGRNPIGFKINTTYDRLAATVFRNSFKHHALVVSIKMDHSIHQLEFKPSATNYGLFERLKRFIKEYSDRAWIENFDEFCERTTSKAEQWKELLRRFSSKEITVQQFRRLRKRFFPA